MAGHNQYTRDNAGRKHDTKPVSVKFSDEEKAAVEDLARKHGMSRNAWIVSRAITESSVRTKHR